MHLILSKFRELSRFTKAFRYCLPFLFLALTSCATHKAQYGKNVSAPEVNSEKVTNEKPTHRFFLIGDAGNSDKEDSKETLNRSEELV